MKKLLFVFVCLLIVLVFSSFFGWSVSPSTKMAHKISREIGSKLKAKYGLEFMGISEEGTTDKYKRIGLELNYRRGILTKDQGRRLLLCCAEDALKAFNSYPKFRKHMVDVPFTSYNIVVNIYVQPYKNPDVYYPNISVFTLYDNLLWYKMDSPANRYEYFAEEEESLDEARRIVMAQSHRK